VWQLTKPRPHLFVSAARYSFSEKGLDCYLEIAENTENFAKSYLIHFNSEKYE
jgi:hypothetical protein